MKMIQSQETTKEMVLELKQELDAFAYDASSNIEILMDKADDVLRKVSADIGAFKNYLFVTGDSIGVSLTNTKKNLDTILLKADHNKDKPTEEK